MPKNKNTAEHETRMYWRLAGELKNAYETFTPPDDTIDELEVLRDYTNNQLLKTRINMLCSAYAQRYRERQSAKKRATA